LINQKIIPNPPTGLVVTDSSSQTIAIKWRKNTEANFLRYRIYRNTIPNPITKVDSTTGGITDTSKTFTGLTNGIRYYFRVTAVDSAGNESGYSNEVNAVPQSGVGIENNNIIMPTVFSLEQNYPNPFNPTTTIKYAIPNVGTQHAVSLRIFDLLGREVAVLVNETKSAGYDQVEWHANVASGMYFYRLEVVSTSDPDNRFVDTKKMLLLK
jgi:hypothetical protein